MRLGDRSSQSEKRENHRRVCLTLIGEWKHLRNKSLSRKPFHSNNVGNSKALEVNDGIGKVLMTLNRTNTVTLPEKRISKAATDDIKYCHTTNILKKTKRTPQKKTVCNFKNDAREINGISSVFLITRCMARSHTHTTQPYPHNKT